MHKNKMKFKHIFFVKNKNMKKIVNSPALKIIISAIICLVFCFSLCGCARGVLGYHIKNMPNRIVYQIGENVNFDGLAIETINIDGTHNTLRFLKDDIQPVDTSTAGKKKVVVEKNNISVSFDVFVANVVVNDSDNLKEIFSTLNNGDIVYMRAGNYLPKTADDTTYKDIVINKSITIVGDGQNKTVFGGNFVVGANFDGNFLSQIESTNSTLENFKFTSPKEEGEKCQLVERGILEKFREENSHNEDQIKKLNFNINDMKFKLFKSTGENNFIKQGAEFQNKQKSDNKKQILFLQDLLEECKTLNKNLKENLTEKKIQKDALFNALYNYMKKYDENMAIEMKSIIYCYNKQLYMMNNKGVDEKYIDSLFSQIKIKEKLLTSKNKEIKELERFLIVPIKKKGKKKDKKKIEDNKKN